jgi:hypothetical protein
MCEVLNFLNGVEVLISVTVKQLRDQCTGGREYDLRSIDVSSTPNDNLRPICRGRGQFDYVRRGKIERDSHPSDSDNDVKPM